MSEATTTQRRARLVPLAALCVGIPWALAACGSGDERPAAPAQRPAAPERPAEPATHRDFDRRRFTDSTTVDNRWYPLRPGTAFTYVGEADRGAGRRGHRVVFTVTDLVKEVDGVRALVLWDRDINAGRLLEEELAFHAQDDDGNVWNLGEYPEEREDGRVVGAPDTWFSGLRRARAGILMRAEPRVGTSSYLQGVAPAIEFFDRAKVHRMGARTCVPTGCYDDVLITDEWTPVEPGAHQRKFYAAGVGNVRVGFAGRDPEAEVLVLEEVRQLAPEELAAARRRALQLDRRGRRVSPDLYGRTPPVEPLAAGR